MFLFEETCPIFCSFYLPGNNSLTSLVEQALGSLWWPTFKQENPFFYTDKEILKGKLQYSSCSSNAICLLEEQA